MTSLLLCSQGKSEWELRENFVFWVKHEFRFPIFSFVKFIIFSVLRFWWETSNYDPGFESNFDRVKWWWCRLKPDFLSNSDIFLPSPYQLTPRISKRLFTPSKFSHDTDFQTDIMLNNSHDTCTHKISLWSKFLHSPSTDTFSKKKSIKFIYNIRNRNTS